PDRRAGSGLWAARRAQRRAAAGTHAQGSRESDPRGDRTAAPAAPAARTAPVRRRQARGILQLSSRPAHRLGRYLTSSPEIHTEARSNGGSIKCPLRVSAPPCECSSAQSEIPRIAFLVGAQDLARDTDAVHLVGAVVDAAEAGVAVHAFERRVGADAFGAEDLDGAIDGIVQHLRADHLDDADLDTRRIARIDLVRGVERQQAAGLNLRRGLEDHLLHLLLVGERGAKGAARVGALAHQSEGALRLAEPAHAGEDAARPEPLLRDEKAAAAR